MRKVLILALMALLVLSIVPMATAAPAAQFAGCADELGEEVGARLQITSLNGLTFELTAVGVDGFDPEITVLDSEGTVIACDSDSGDAELFAVDLPNVTAEASEASAQVSVTVPGDEGRLDYEVIVTSADNTSGEFVLFYEGAEVFGSDDTDTFFFVLNDAQAEGEVPLGIYVANLQRPELSIDPEVTFVFEEIEQTCGKSSADSLCAGESEDLTGYTVTGEDGEPYELNGDDVMLFYELGGEAAEFEIQVGSYEDASFGAYTMMIYSGVIYPEVEEE